MVSWGMVFPRDPENLVRHASQLYQAFLEGLVLFCIIYWFTRKPRPRLAPAALFIIGYGVFRFFVEFFREPDAHLQDLAFGWMTRGQMLTTPMIIGGLAIMLWAYRTQTADSVTQESSDQEPPTKKSTPSTSKKRKKKK